jgi:60 kDa SS-A/Ro ribonucleoprotein
MSNLNNKRVAPKPKTVKNHEGSTSFTMNAKESLVNIANTSLISNKFYETKEEGVAELVGAIEALQHSDPEFVLKTAAYARREMHMRSVPQVILAECASREAFKPFIRKWGKLIMSRADEPSDVLSYYINTHGKPLPNALKRSVKDALEGFSEYSLTRYQRKGAKVSLADTIKITHPNLGEIGKKILEGTAKVDTWETNLSSGKKETKKDAWEASIPKMGYMALLRNLRNMIQEDVDDDLFNGVLAKLTNVDEVKKSKQFPFRFFSAMKVIEDMDVSNGKTKRAIKAVIEAMEISAKNVNIEGKTLFLVDSSGSMGQTISDKSTVTALDVALLMGVTGCVNSDESDLWTFDTNPTTRDVNQYDTILSQMTKLKKQCRGGATYLGKAISMLKKSGVAYDNVVVISDYQCYEDNMWGGDINAGTAWKQYKTVAPEAKLYTIDTVGYNKGTPFQKKSGDVFLFAGWSEKILEMIGSGSSSGLVDEIEEWNPQG